MFYYILIYIHLAKRQCDGRYPKRKYDISPKSTKSIRTTFFQHTIIKINSQNYKWAEKIAKITESKVYVVIPKRSESKIELVEDNWPCELR